MHYHANDSCDWLISWQQNVNSSREATSILSGKYRRFMFVYPVVLVYDISINSLPVNSRQWKKLLTAFSRSYKIITKAHRMLGFEGVSARHHNH